MNKGFTLIEQVTVIFLIGIIAAIAIPYFLQQPDKARYSAALAVMRSIAPDIQEYQAINDTYPPDVGADESPDQIPWQFRESLPWNSPIDYEHWRIGNGMCLVQITYFGKDGDRDSERYTPVISGDDRGIVIAMYSESDGCPGGVGAVR